MFESYNLYDGNYLCFHFIHDRKFSLRPIRKFQIKSHTPYAIVAIRLNWKQ